MIASTLFLAALQAASPALGQEPVPFPVPTTTYPFGVGESFGYTAKLGFIKLGRGTISVPGIDTVQGVPSFVFRFQIKGGIPLYKLNSVMESRTGIADFQSRRFTQDNDENGRLRIRHYDIFPDSGFYRLEGEDESHPTSAEPLDDAAFLYFIRSFPLVVGETYEFSSYYKKDKNPLIITVDKREKCDLPDDTTVQCLVVLPVMGDRGIFARRAEAKVWLTDDERRIPVKIRSRYPFGTVVLRLDEMHLVAPTPRSQGGGRP